MNAISRRRLFALGGAATVGGLGVATGLRPAEAAGTHRLVVITANIGRERKDLREKAIRDVRYGIDGAKPLVGWQEIGEGDGDRREAAWIDHYMGTHYRNPFLHHDHAFRVPISVPDEYKIIGRAAAKTHDGLAYVTPERWLTAVALQRVDDPGIKFVLINTHYVAGAWNGVDNGHEHERDVMWQQHFDGHKSALHYWLDKGYPVIWTADTNRATGMPLLDPAERRVPVAQQPSYSHPGYDKIRYTPGTNGTKINFQRSTYINTDVDGHNAQVAIFTLSR